MLLASPTAVVAASAPATQAPTAQIATAPDVASNVVAALAEPGAPLRAHADDVADYTLRAVLDADKHVIHGDGTIRWRNASVAPVRELWLHLYLNAFKNERSAFLRERVGGRGSGPPEDFGAIDVRTLMVTFDGVAAAFDALPVLETHRPGDDDETDARVPLPRDVPPGGRIAITVAFDSKLPSIIERTGYAGTFVLAGQWFPKLSRLEPDGTWAHFPFHHLAEFYADFGTYDVTLDVPEGYVIGATGPAIESRAVAGRHVERHVQADVHDFAWTAWDRFVTRHDRIDAVDVTLLYPPGFDAVAERELEAVRFALPYDSERYGAYPYGVLTIVHPQEDAREAGGMEYPTFITSGGPFWMPASVRQPEIVTVHELGHQWFYGLVATNESAWPLLDEGINQYAEVNTVGRLFGDGSALDILGVRVSDAALVSLAAERVAADEPIAQPAAAFSTGTRYGELVYARTAALLTTLDRVYDGASTRALALYARRHRFEHPGPDDLVRAFADVAGDPAATALRTALFDKGWVDYAIEGAQSTRAETPAGLFDGATGVASRERKSRSLAGGYEGSVLVRRRGTLRFPVDVELLFEDGSTRRERWDGAGDWTRIAWRGQAALKAARVDPDGRVLVDEDPLDNVTQVAEGQSTTWRFLERAAFYAGLALQALSL